MVKLVVGAESVKFPLTGIGRYTCELINELAKNDELSEFNVHKEMSIVGVETFINTDFQKNTGSDGLFKLESFIRKIPLARMFYRILKGLIVKRALRTRYGDYIYHGTNFIVPDFHGKKVVTIHDLSVLSHPECHPSERVQHMTKEIERSIKNTDYIISVSQYTKDQIIKYFDFAEERIFVTPLAASEDYKPRSESDVAKVIARHGLQVGGYTLFVGTIEPRKNLISLLKAYKQLNAQLKADKPLVFVGHKGWESHEIHQEMKNAEKEGWLKYLGYVSNEDLPYLFSGARLFVYPSLLEGFGLPVLEAMTSGVPVVCSNTSSLPEVGGEAAAACAPDDIETMAEYIERGLVDDAWRESAIEKGLLRAKEFSWARCADLTLDVYKKFYEK